MQLQLLDYIHPAKPSQYYLSGQIIFEEGEVGDQLFIVVNGSVALIVNHRLVEVVQEGDIFGEMALIDGEKRSATAIAGADCRVVPISLTEFTLLAQYNFLFLNQILKTLARRLRTVNSLMLTEFSSSLL